MVWHETFSTHKDGNLHHMATLFDNTNAGSKPEQGDQIVHGVFCPTSTKSHQNVGYLRLRYSRELIGNFAYAIGTASSLHHYPTCDGVHVMLKRREFG